MGDPYFDNENKLDDIFASMTDVQQKVTIALMKLAITGFEPEELEDKWVVECIIKSMTNEQRTAMYALVGSLCPSTDEKFN